MTAIDVRLAKSDAANASLRIAAVTGQIGQVLINAPAVDTPCPPVASGQERGACEGGCVDLKEMTPVHHGIRRIWDTDSADKHGIIV